MRLAYVHIRYKMAACVWKACNSHINTKFYNNFIGSVRHGHRMRGKPPNIARSLQQRLNELNYKDPGLTFRVDIGFPSKSKSRSEDLSKRLEHVKRNRTNSELEKLSRNRKLTIDIDKVKEDWLATAGPHQIKKIADHYGVYEHLFGDAYFLPRKPLKILFEADDCNHPVYFGNVIKPTDAAKQPSVKFNSDDDSLWTLIMTNPDGHLTKANSEYVHWFIGNIKGNDVSKGDVIIDYLPPFPPKGTGYHRHIFILYKQKKVVDYCDFKKQQPCLNLNDRTFSTLEFYRERQDCLTPAGLAFFQSDWDKSLTHFFHNTLNMREPVFEYDFAPPYIKPQTWFALRQPFNLYMDKYKDPREVRERYFKEKLKGVHPFQAPKPKLPFPNAEPLPPHIPSWLKLEIRKKRLGWGRINDVACVIFLLRNLINYFKKQERKNITGDEGVLGCS